jgi:hypothetical protein
MMQAQKQTVTLHSYGVVYKWPMSTTGSLQVDVCLQNIALPLTTQNMISCLQCIDQAHHFIATAKVACNMLAVVWTERGLNIQICMKPKWHVLTHENAPMAANDLKVNAVMQAFNFDKRMLFEVPDCQVHGQQYYEELQVVL